MNSLPNYPGVCVRLLRKDERLVLSQEESMPLVLEAKADKSPAFLQNILKEYSENIKDDLLRYGAILLRGFDIRTEEIFEKTVLSIPFFNGIRDAFMSEEGRDHLDNLQFVLHTNAIYKTGGTAYLGGFHSENYYSADVPSFINFFCLKPSKHGGETGIINMRKVYQALPTSLQKKLEEKPFLASKWLVKNVAKRYKLALEEVEELCIKFDLPLIGEGRNKFILMYKPNVFLDPVSGEKALQINFFQIYALNKVLRRFFMADYPGHKWVIHRFVWKLPEPLLKIMEYLYMSTKAFLHSPKDALLLLRSKIDEQIAWSRTKIPRESRATVNSCFEKEEVELLAKLMRDYYSSCLWQKNDILLIDNKQVVHAGMPGSGPRTVRALISNPLQMHYAEEQSGILICEEKKDHSIGHLAENHSSGTEKSG